MGLSSGFRLGAYEILGSVGSGGMGEVYRAHDPRLGRGVALKILPESMAKDPEGLARFTREARAVAALNHPHIVTIFSTEEADGVRFMTMELIEGRTLDRMIPEGGVSLAQFFDVSMAIADALSAAHQKQITHRDLKPANVMVTDAGRVKVLDFGLARGGEGTDSGATSIEEQATRHRLTQAGTILGTMPYMSPEQIEAKALDGRSDIFSLGIVMYEMATGGRPFRGETSPSLMSSIMREHPKSASELRPDLPGDVSRLLGKCLEKNPRDRMQTAHEILVELKALKRACESGSLESRALHRPTPSTVTDPATRPARAEDLRIAVLPFVPRPAGGEAEALADGLTEDIAAGLARFAILRVVSRAEVDRLRGQMPDAATSTRMGARYFVDGSVRVAGPSLRVSTRLVDASTGTHIWAETYERSLEAGVFALQDDIANRVIASVADSNGALVRSMAAALRDRPLQELSNPELVIRFEAYIQRNRVEEHAPLRQAFEVAVEREPNDANAWAALALLVTHELWHGYNPRPNSAERARAAVERAIDIDSTCTRAWVVLAGARLVARDLSGLRAAAQRLFEINPLDTSKLAAAAWMLTCAGDIERGEDLARRAMSLHSNTAGWYRLPTFFRRFFAGEYQQALEAAKQVGIDSWAPTHLTTASAAGQVGSAPDARGAIEALKRIEPGWVSVERARAWYGGWVWDEDAVDRLVEGFEKALALAGAEPASQPHPATSRTSSGPSTTGIRSGQTASPAVNRDYVVAVHPFTSHGSDDESTGLARGLTEDIGTALSRFQYFTVRTSKDADTRYAVSGSLRRSGNSIRVSARLIDADTGANLWAENYDRTLGATSFFDLQDEITARLVSTVGSSSGPLVKAMASPLRERPVAELSLHELVLRCSLYFGGMRIEEHARLRAAFEKALTDQPNHALGWAALAGLYEHEVSWGMNPLPGSMDRATRAARRSVEIDPACQFGWSRLIVTSFHTNDRNGMKNAGDRVIALNPLNQNAVGVAGCYFAAIGDWDRGIPMVRRAIDLDPNHYGLLHGSLYLDHYRKKEYEEALAQAKRINAFETATVPLSLASAAVELGRVDEARAALEVLDRNHPKHNTVEAARSHWAWFLRDSELIDRLVEGFEKARALVAAEPLASSAATKARGSHRSADEARPPALGALQSTPRPTVAMLEAASSGSSRIEQPTPGSSVATSPSSGPTASIAVLPFTDMSAAKDQDWFCDGIAEEILNALAGLKGLSVAARASAFSFRGKGDDLKAIGDKLNVTTVLDGSVRRAGDQLRITVRLSDVANGYQLWSERYDRSVNDIFDVQDEIAKAVAGRLRVTLGDDPASLPRVIRHTENQKAYHLYLRGRHHWYSRRKDALEKARDCFEEAIKLDPEYALAYVGLADLYTAQGIYAYAPEREVGPKARAAVERALAINGQLADAYRAMGFMQIFIDWDVRAAERNFQKALALDPTSALSYTWLAWPTWPGREEVAMAAVRRAQELDPLNPYINTLVGAVHDFWGNAEEGLEQSLKALDIDSNYLVALYIMGGVYSHLGRHDEALDLLGRALQASGRAPFFLGYLGWEQASAGRTAEARETLAELDKRAATEYVSPLFPAMVHSGLGEMDRAFELLQEAVRTGNCWIGCPRMRMFDGFRKDPRFVEHLRRIGHPDIPVEG